MHAKMFFTLLFFLVSSPPLFAEPASRFPQQAKLSICIALEVAMDDPDSENDIQMCKEDYTRRRCLNGSFAYENEAKTKVEFDVQNTGCFCWAKLFEDVLGNFEAEISGCA